MSMQTFLADWNEIMTIKKWREDNNIIVDEQFFAKANKREKMITKFWIYAVIFAFVLGLIIGVLI